MNPNSLTESILYVMALYEQDPKMKGLHWSRVFNMMQFALAEDHRPPIPAYQRRLRPQYRLVWKWLHLEGIPGIHEKAPLLRLREHMTRTGELPADLPTYDFSEVYLNWHRLRSHMDEELVVHLEDIPCPSALPGAWPV
ncbi:uncharacterized protein BDV14DRAFT_176672 [Aspergillus stella-maris]|uniref:uncharacterized protein n=1 Tax=Aspergillus stella-maris TaxID=1810926 RepID=UPI003CCDCE22